MALTGSTALVASVKREWIAGVLGGAPAMLISSGRLALRASLKVVVGG